MTDDDRTKSYKLAEKNKTKSCRRAAERPSRDNKQSELLQLLQIDYSAT